MFPNKSQLQTHAMRVRQAHVHNLQARHRWKASLKASATSPRGLALGFAAGFGIGCMLRGSPTEEVRKLMTLPALISTVRTLLLTQ